MLTNTNTLNLLFLAVWKKLWNLTRQTPTYIQHLTVFSLKAQCCLLQLLHMWNNCFYSGQFFIICFRVFLHSVFLLHYSVPRFSLVPNTGATDTAKNIPKLTPPSCYPPKGTGGVFFVLCPPCALTENDIILCTEKEWSCLKEHLRKTYDGASGWSNHEIQISSPSINIWSTQDTLRCS